MHFRWLNRDSKNRNVPEISNEIHKSNSVIRIDWKWVNRNGIDRKLKQFLTPNILLHNELLRAIFSYVSKLDNRLYRKYTSTVWIQTNSEHWLLQLSCGQQCNIGHGVCESFFSSLFVPCFPQNWSHFSLVMHARTPPTKLLNIFSHCWAFDVSLSTSCASHSSSFSLCDTS